MKTLNIKKDDKVLVIAGKDKGKRSHVLSVFHDENKILVSDVNVVSKHEKPKSAQDRGGIKKQEAKIDVSNVKVICPSCDKPTRVGKKILDNGKKIRVCKKCAEELKVTSKKSKSKKQTKSKKK